MNRSDVLRAGFGLLPSTWRESIADVLRTKGVNDRQAAANRALVDEALRMSAGCLASVDSMPAWGARRHLTRPALADMLCVDLRGTRPAPGVSITGSFARKRYRVDKLLLETAPGLLLTANYYQPLGVPEPTALVLYLNGHWPHPHGAKAGYQDRYLWYPDNGFALLVVDPMGFGEVPGIHHGTQSLGWLDWISKGYSPAGVEVWNAMRALDWVVTRQEIDATRIGVTGISGGGVMAQYLAAVDDRVAAVAASCSTFTIGDQVRRNLVPKQCDCTFVPNVPQLDFPEVLALIAPRPLLILGGRRDPIFPTSGFRAAYARVRALYDLAGWPEVGVADRLRLVESRAGHTDPPEFLVETRRWMMRWLRQTGGDPSSAGPAPESSDALRVLGSHPRVARNAAVHVGWTSPTTERQSVSPAVNRADRRAITEYVRGAAFRWFPEQPGPVAAKRRMRGGGLGSAFASASDWSLQTELPGVSVRVAALAPANLEPGHTGMLIVVRSDQTAGGSADIEEMLPLLGTHVITQVWPRFSERAVGGSERTRIERTAALVGRSILSMQVWDALRTIEWAKQTWPSRSRISLYASGDMAPVSLYAGLLEGSVSRVVLRSPPASHDVAPPLPLVQRRTDLAEVAFAMGPGVIRFLGYVPQEYFEPTRAPTAGWSRDLIARDLLDALTPAHPEGQ